MKYIPMIAVLAASSFGVMQAQAADKMNDPKEKGPATTGAMQDSSATGIARDAGEVKQQQGNSAKSSPGTVGAAPGADTPSQTPGR